MHKWTHTGKFFVLSRVLLLKEDTWFQWCLCYLIKHSVQFAILMKIRHLHCNWSPLPGLTTTRKRSIPPYQNNSSHQYLVTKAQAEISDVTQKKGTLYPSLESDLLKWRTEPKWLASGNISSNGELWPQHISASFRDRLCCLTPRQHKYCTDHTASSCIHMVYQEYYQGMHFFGVDSSFFSSFKSVQGHF